MNEDIYILQQAVTTAAIKIGISDSIAADLARIAIEAVRKKCEGSDIYIPKHDKRERNRRIKLAFSGANHDEVCAAFGISRRTLYRVIAN